MEKCLIGKDINFQPANQIFHLSGGYIFQRMRASVKSGSSNCVELLIFNVPRDNILNVLGQYLLLPKYQISAITSQT